MKSLTRPPFVLAHPADNAGCGYHRVTRRLDLLGRAGLINGRQDMQLYTAEGIVAVNPDVIVLQRQHEVHQREAVLRYRQQLPTAHLVYEIDDILSAVPDESPHKPHIRSDIDEQIAATATLCDSITVTTRALAKHMRTICGDMDIRIAPNMLGRDDFVNAAKARANSTLAAHKPRIGWGGSMSHVGDLKLIYEVIQKTYHKIDWVFLGIRPDLDLPIEFHEGVQPSDYLVKLASLNLDLVVAPLDDNQFNRCKSNLRLIECGACSYPVIASPVEPYLEGNPPVVAHAAPTTAAWLGAIEAFLRLPLDKQREHGRKLHAWAEKNFCLDDHAVETVKHWLPKNTKPFVPSRSAGNGHLVIAASAAVPTAPNLRVMSMAAALASDANVLFLRDGTTITAEQIARLEGRLNKADVATVTPLSNGGGLAGFPKKESLMACDSNLATIFEKTLATLEPSEVDLIHPSGPAILVSRRALNFCGHPNIVESDPETSLVEWGIMAGLRGFKNTVATDTYVVTDRVYAPPDINLVTGRIQTRWPLKNQNDDPLAVLRATLEVKFYKEHFKGTVTRDPTSYMEWAKTFDTIGKRDLAALAANNFPTKFAVVGAAHIEPQSHTNYEVVNASLFHSADTAKDWVVFVRDKAILRGHALSLFASTIEVHPDAYLIYADHDTLNNGVREAHDFKPNFDLDMLLSRDYITPIFAVKLDKLSLLDNTSETRLYREVLDLIARHGREGVVHIPKILAHLAPITQTRQFGLVAQKAQAANALTSSFGINATIAPCRQYPGIASINFGTEPFDEPLVTIVIPCKDRHDMLQPCVDSILFYTAYKNYQILIVDNGSTAQKMLDYQASLRGNPKITLTSWRHPFNWAALNNFAAANSTGEYLLFLNDDTRIKTDDWLTNMTAAAMRPSVGAVGAKLMYPYGMVQHVGVPCSAGLTGHIHKLTLDGQPGYNGYCYITHEATAVTGACLMIARAKFEEVGGFDERMPFNFNDVALCTDLYKRGYKNVVAASAIVEHCEGATRPPTTDSVGTATLQAEALILAEHWPHIDPYWNPNLHFQHSQDGTRVSGMNFELFHCAFNHPWRGDGWKNERVLVIGDSEEMLRRVASAGDTALAVVVGGHQMLVTNPPMQNLPPIDLRNGKDISYFIAEMGIDRIIVRSIEGMSAEVLGVLATLQTPITYWPKNAEAACPRSDFMVNGIDCGKGYDDALKCQQCMLAHGSDFGVVSIVGWRDAWERFLSYVTLDTSDLSEAAKAALGHVYGVNEATE